MVIAGIHSKLDEEITTKKVKPTCTKTHHLEKKFNTNICLTITARLCLLAFVLSCLQNLRYTGIKACFEETASFCNPEKILRMNF